MLFTHSLVFDKTHIAWLFSHVKMSIRDAVQRALNHNDGRLKQNKQ